MCSGFRPRLAGSHEGRQHEPALPAPAPRNPAAADRRRDCGLLAFWAGVFRWRRLGRTPLSFGASNAETDSLDFAVRLLAVGVSANCARASAQSTARAVTEPGTSTPSGLIQNRHSGLDTARCDTANYHALPANAGSAQPIAHCGVLPVEFNADRLTFVGLKHETDPACRDCSQGFAAHPGGRRLFNAAEAGKVDPQSKSGMDRMPSGYRRVRASEAIKAARIPGSRSNARPAAPFPAAI